VSRPLVEVRGCREADLPAVVRMWEEMVELNSRMARTGPAPSLRNAAALLDLVHRTPGHRLVVAVVGEEPAGMACFTHQPFAPLHPVGSIHVSYLHVSGRYRRRGVGHALVAAAAAYADELNADQVVAGVVPGLREPNRFFARLGFSPVMTNRAVPTAALRRRLAVEAHARPVEDLLALRRSLRSRQRRPEPARPAPVPTSVEQAAPVEPETPAPEPTAAPAPAPVTGPAAMVPGPAPVPAAPVEPTGAG
jgi:GNAT superfamily N-acetyltransferase